MSFKQDSKRTDLLSQNLDDANISQNIYQQKSKMSPGNETPVNQAKNKVHQRNS